jgi:thymidylate kinase
MFIVIEGTDAAGKATQAKLLTDRIEHSVGKPVLHLAFPRYETLLGCIISDHLKGHMKVCAPAGASYMPKLDAMVFQCLMAADKYSAMPLITAALNAEGWVVADRWWQSALAYGQADGLTATWLRNVHTGLPVGDLNFFIDVDPEEAQRRRPEARDRYEQDRAKQLRVQANYQRIWQDKAASSGWHIINGMASVELVHDRIWRVVEEVGGI